MRKNRYRCKRYRLFLPKVIGEALDTEAEYVVRLIGPAVVIVPKGLESFFSRLEKLENTHRENIIKNTVLCADSLPKASSANAEHD